MSRMSRVDVVVSSCIGRLMPKWKSKLYYMGKPISDGIPVRRGIFQGDALSPLVFILAVNTIILKLNQTSFGIQWENDSGCLKQAWYMDDCKLYAEDSESLNTAVSTLQLEASKAGLSLNPTKRPVIEINNGKAVSASETGSGIVSTFATLSCRQAFGH
jgi:Reverse transcriptase (RNA-dependent DNA polymerase)